MQYQHHRKTDRRSTLVPAPAGADASRTKEWFEAWHDTVGGPDNISASARDALLHLLQIKDTPRTTRLRIKWKDYASELVHRL